MLEYSKLAFTSIMHDVSTLNHTPASRVSHLECTIILSHMGNNFGRFNQNTPDLQDEMVTQHFLFWHQTSDHLYTVI